MLPNEGDNEAVYEQPDPSRASSHKGALLHVLTELHNQRLIK